MEKSGNRREKDQRKREMYRFRGSLFGPCSPFDALCWWPTFHQLRTYVLTRSSASALLLDLCTLFERAGPRRLLCDSFFKKIKKKISLSQPVERHHVHVYPSLVHLQTSKQNAVEMSALYRPSSLHSPVSSSPSRPFHPLPPRFHLILRDSIVLLYTPSDWEKMTRERGRERRRI